MEQQFTLSDSYKHKGLRRQLAQSVKKKGIRNDGIISAIEKVPRHFFLDSAFAEQAYQDKALQIDEGQTISQPYTVAYQTMLLDIKPGDKVLEIGTGSGYQACILIELGAEVYSIERIQSLSDKAKTLLNMMGYSPNLFVGDGTLGLPDHAPFDKIIVTAAAPEIPKALIDQLKSGGKLVVPVGDRDSQTMVQVVKESETMHHSHFYETFRFVPLIGQKGWKS